MVFSSLRPEGDMSCRLNRMMDILYNIGNLFSNAFRNYPWPLSQSAQAWKFSAHDVDLHGAGELRTLIK